jgi:hypothetical protein
MSSFVPQYGILIVRYKIALEIEKPLVHRLGAPTVLHDVLYNSINKAYKRSIITCKAKVSGFGNLFHEV